MALIPAHARPAHRGSHPQPGRQSPEIGRGVDGGFNRSECQIASGSITVVLAGFFNASAVDDGGWVDGLLPSPGSRWPAHSPGSRCIRTCSLPLLPREVSGCFF